jgi:hypothetical protein
MPTNIDELLAMEAKATPGPWKVLIDDIDGYPWVCAGDGEEIERIDYLPKGESGKLAAFIAALRNAAPGLLAELRETRAALAAWMAAKESRTAFWRDHVDDLVLHDSDEALALDDAIDAAEDVLMGIGERVMSEPLANEEDGYGNSLQINDQGVLSVTGQNVSDWVDFHLYASWGALAAVKAAIDKLHPPVEVDIERQRLERAMVEVAKAARRSQIANMELYDGPPPTDPDAWADERDKAEARCKKLRVELEKRTDALLAFEAAQEAKQAHQNTAP